MVSTLARASMDGAILVAAVWVLSRILRLTPATRTVLWWCAAAKFVVSLAWTTPIAIPVLPVETTVVHRMDRAAAPHGESLSRVPRSAAPARPDLGGPLVRALREWSSFAAIAWSLGLLLVSIVGLRRWRGTVQMLNASEPAPDDVQAHAIDLASRLRLRRVPEVRLSARIETPLVTGLVRPVVLLPSGCLEALTDRQWQLALCHELAHLKRADLWLGCVPALAERVFFFHPLVHLASREYALSREAACDAAVMETLDAAPQEYGRLLLSLGVSHPRTGFAAAGGAWSFLSLKRRIAMLQDESVRSNRSRVMAYGAVGLAVAAMVPMQLSARPQSIGNADRSGLVASTANVAAPAASIPAASSAASNAASNALNNDQLLEPAADDPAGLLEPAVQVESRQPASRGLSFVLMLEDDHQTTSGSPEDVARAERHRRNGEPLLWFRYDGREYVVRDPELLRQTRALWADVYDSDFGPHAISAAAQALEALKIDQLVEHGVRAAEKARLGAHLGSIVAEQGMLGAQLGSMAAEQALHALTNAHAAMAGIDQAELARHRRAMDEAGKEIKEKMHALKHRLKDDLDSQMKELHHQLRALEEPMRGMAAPMEEFGHRMKAFGQTIEKATRRANDEMRALVDRALASGLAQPVR